MKVWFAIAAGLVFCFTSGALATVQVTSGTLHASASSASSGTITPVDVTFVPPSSSTSASSSASFVNETLMAKPQDMNVHAGMSITGISGGQATFGNCNASGSATLVEDSTEMLLATISETADIFAINGTYDFKLTDSSNTVLFNLPRGGASSASITLTPGTYTCAWTMSDAPAAGSSNNLAPAFDLAVVPEPTSLVWISGMLALTGRRRPERDKTVKR